MAIIWFEFFSIIQWIHVDVASGASVSVTVNGQRPPKQKEEQEEEQEEEEEIYEKNI